VSPVPAPVTAPHYDRAPVVSGWPIGHDGRVGVRVVRWGRNHHGRGRSHDGAEEGEPDPEGEVDPSTGETWCREQRQGQYPRGKRSLRHGPVKHEAGADVAGWEVAPLNDSRPRGDRHSLETPSRDTLAAGAGDGRDGAVRVDRREPFAASELAVLTLGRKESQAPTRSRTAAPRGLEAARPLRNGYHDGPSSSQP